MTKDQSVESLRYWIGLSECDCASEHPIGGCLKCDLKGILEFINRGQTAKPRIKCAAIRYEGKIYEGVSHAEIGLRMIKEHRCPRPFPGGKDQGFVTDSGEFVTRGPALQIAIAAGQVEEGKTIHSKHLFSEDYRDIQPKEEE